MPMNRKVFQRGTILTICPSLRDFMHNCIALLSRSYRGPTHSPRISANKIIWFIKFDTRASYLGWPELYIGVIGGVLGGK